MFPARIGPVSRVPVASPDIDPYWGNFRVGGHLSGTPEIGPLFENCPSILRDFLCAKCH
jgi:hypothetical protein